MSSTTFETVIGRVSIKEELYGIVEVLLGEGATGIDLDLLLQGVLNVSLTEANVARLNLIGSLRGAGYQVSGGRGGGKFYKILDWSPPRKTETIESWDYRSIRSLEEIRSLHRIDDQSEVWGESWFERHILERVDDTHENGWLYLRTYEISDRNEGFVFLSDHGSAAIIQKFKNSPRFNILQLDADVPSLAGLAKTLGEISMANVKILNPRRDDLKLLEWFFPSGRIVSHTQAMYDVHDIATNPEKYWRHKTCRNMKSALRDTEFFPLSDGAVELQTTVIDEWRKVNEPKQRQLAVRRDYVAANVSARSKVVVLGIQDGSIPVSVNVFDKLVDRPVVGHIVEKALNYTSMPGGRSGTSDLSIWQSCVLLDQMGITYINGGMVDGGAAGLAEHKKHLACEIKKVVVFDTGERRH